MVEFLAYWMMIGIVISNVAIMLTKSNPDGPSVFAAVLMWPVVLYNLIRSISVRKE